MQQSAAYDEQAAFADRQAVMEGQAGAYEADLLRTQNTRALDGMRQQYSSSGIDPNSGSAREVIEDSARDGARNEQAVLSGAILRADNLRFNARLSRSNAESARIGGMFGAVSSVLGGVTNAFDFQNKRSLLGGGTNTGGSQSLRTVLTNPYGVIF